MSWKPKPGKPYLYVKVENGTIICAILRDFGDGSGGFNLKGTQFGAEQFQSFRYEFEAEGWQTKLKILTEMGFLPVFEARRQNLIPREWKPLRKDLMINYYIIQLSRRFQTIHRLIKRGDLADFRTADRDLQLEKIRRLLRDIPYPEAKKPRRKQKSKK